MKTPRTETAVLVAALRILVRDIQSDDGVANAAIAEAADRLAELERDVAALKIERNRLRRALLDCSDAAIGGSTLATWIRGKVAATLGKETRP